MHSTGALGVNAVGLSAVRRQNDARNPRVGRPRPHPNSTTSLPIDSTKTAGSRIPSPPPPSKRNISEEKRTRIEISFERFRNILLASATLRSKSVSSALRRLSYSVVASEQWKNLLDVFLHDVLPEHNPTREADPELRFVDILNFITGEGSKLETGGGPTAPLLWGIQLESRPPPPSRRTSSDHNFKLDTGSGPLSAASFIERKRLA